MANIVVVLVIVTQLFIYSDGGKGKMKKIIWFHDFGPCPGTHYNTTVTGDFKYAGNGNVFMTIAFDIDGTVPHLFFFVTLKKCPTKVLTEDCEDMMSFPVGDQCIPENAYFVDLYHQFKPPIECPISGRHIAKEVRFPQDIYSSFFRGLEDDEWLHVMINIYSDEKRTHEEVCIRTFVAMKKIRVGTKS